MAKTTLITGSSSGIGKAAAILFAEKGWNVIATTRKTEKLQDLRQYPNITILKLDVTDNKNIEQVIQAVIEKYGKIDIVVNNAGYGLFGPVEAMEYSQIEDQFRTNVFGVINICQAVLPHMRKNQDGRIIIVSSMLGRISLPFSSLYGSSKWAVEGFSESLAFELEPHRVQVKLIEPGAIKTKFFKSTVLANGRGVQNYEPRYSNVMQSIDQKGESGVSPDNVAKIIWKAANDNSGKLRYQVDFTSRLLIALHRHMPLSVYRRIIKNSVG
jgi:short-subunit dehydrogenase